MERSSLVKNNVKNIGIILCSFLIIVIIILKFTGYISLWTKGMGSIANNTKEFTNINSHVIDGEYSIYIDLGDLESNEGKELYNDGKNKIYVHSVVKEESVNNGGYKIHFRSSGQYSIDYAELISGVQHIVSSMDMSAKMTAEYNEKIYSCNVMGMSGINYKDGDMFSFYIFPSKAYEKNEVTLDETGAVYLTVTNLYKNVWSKK